MTSKQCLLAALSGKIPQRFPVVTPYSYLMQCNHWTELTGKPPWTYYQWLYSTSMKGYTNDLESIGAQVKGRTCLFGNVDPVNTIQEGTDEQLREEIQRQVSIGHSLGSFVISTGSPITPLTPVERIRQFIDIARELGSN